MITALSRVRSRLRVRWLGGVTVPTRPLNRYPIPQTGELATVNRQLQDAWERLRCETTPRARPSLSPRVPSPCCSEKPPMRGGLSLSPASSHLSHIPGWPLLTLLPRDLVGEEWRFLRAKRRSPGAQGLQPESPISIPEDRVRPQRRTAAPSPTSCCSSCFLRLCSGSASV